MFLESELIIGLGLLVIALLVIGGTVAYLGRFLRKLFDPPAVFDRERRELRCGRTTIPFQDIEVRVFRYHGREPGSGAIPLSVSQHAENLTRGTEWKYRVYARAGKQRVNLDEFRSQTDADEYADEIRATITEG